MRKLVSTQVIILSSAGIATSSLLLSPYLAQAHQPFVLDKQENLEDSTESRIDQNRGNLISPMVFNAPPNLGRPVGRRRGGASRTDDACSYTSQEPLIALVPSDQIVSDTSINNSIDNWESVWTLTASSHPTFWFYTPYHLAGDTPLKFVLLDEGGNIVYQKIWAPTLSGEGILKVETPSFLSGLQPGEKYHWFFIIECDQTYVEGWVERIELDESEKSMLNQASPRDQAIFYASKGIWQDALTVLAELRLAEPQNSALAADWDRLLESVDLSDLSRFILLDCCSQESEQLP